MLDNGATGAVLDWYAFGAGPNDALTQLNVAANTRVTYIPDLIGSVIGALDSGTGAITKTGYQPYGESPRVMLFPNAAGRRTAAVGDGATGRSATVPRRGRGTGAMTGTAVHLRAKARVNMSFGPTPPEPFKAWPAYFGEGTRATAYRAVDNHVSTGNGAGARRGGAAPHRFGVTPLLREAVEQAVAAGGDQVGLAAAA